MNALEEFFAKIAAQFEVQKLQTMHREICYYAAAFFRTAGIFPLVGTAAPVYEAKCTVPANVARLLNDLCKAFYGCSICDAVAVDAKLLRRLSDLVLSYDRAVTDEQKFAFFCDIVHKNSNTRPESGLDPLCNNSARVCARVAPSRLIEQVIADFYASNAPQAEKTLVYFEEAVQRHGLSCSGRLLRCVACDAAAAFELLFGVDLDDIARIPRCDDLKCVMETIFARETFCVSGIELSYACARCLVRFLCANRENFFVAADNLSRTICGFPVQYDVLLADLKCYHKIAAFPIAEIACAALQCYDLRRHEEIIAFVLQYAAQQARNHYNITFASVYAVACAELDVDGTVTRKLELEAAFPRFVYDAYRLKQVAAFFTVYSLECLESADEIERRGAFTSKYGLIREQMLVYLLNSASKTLQISKKIYINNAQGCATQLLVGEFYGSYDDQITRFERAIGTSDDLLAYLAREYIKYSNWLKFERLLDAFKQRCVNQQRFYESVVEAIYHCVE